MYILVILMSVLFSGHQMPMAFVPDKYFDTQKVCEDYLSTEDYQSKVKDTIKELTSEGLVIQTIDRNFCTKAKDERL